MFEMPSTTESFPPISFDEVWDHDMLPDADALWLELQQETEMELPNEYFQGFSANVHVESVLMDTAASMEFDVPVHKPLQLESDHDHDLPQVDTSAMTKEELRKHKNRESAARCRQRSRSRLEQLECMVAELEAKNRHLQHSLVQLRLQQTAPAVAAVQHRGHLV